MVRRAVIVPRSPWKILVLAFKLAVVAAGSFVLRRDVSVMIEDGELHAVLKERT